MTRVWAARVGITHVESRAMNPSVAAEVRRLCDAAYATDTRPFFDSLGPGEHLLGRQGDALVTHLMWVTRWLQPEGRPALRTAYVEMVATAPAEQRNGYASALLQAFPRLVQDYELPRDGGSLCSPQLDLTVPLSVEWRSGEVW